MRKEWCKLKQDHSTDGEVHFGLCLLKHPTIQKQRIYIAPTYPRSIILYLWSLEREKRAIHDSTVYKTAYIYIYIYIYIYMRAVCFMIDSRYRIL